jgi:hypothetical protein
MKKACAMLGIAALSWSAAAQAQLFKCVGADGKTAYQSEPCPATAKEERIKQQAAPVPAPGEPGSSVGPAGMKSGWDRGEILFMQDQCVNAQWGIVQQQGADAALKAPGTKLAAEIQNHCGCIANLASTTWSFLEYSKNPVLLTRQLTDASWKGSDCMPQRELADALRKAGKMR